MYSHGENRERAAEPRGWQRRGRIQPRRGGGGTAGPGGPPHIPPLLPKPWLCLFHPVTPCLADPGALQTPRAVGGGN